MGPYGTSSTTIRPDLKVINDTSLSSIHPCYRYIHAVATALRLLEATVPSIGLPPGCAPKGLLGSAPSRGRGGGLPWTRGSDL